MPHTPTPIRDPATQGDALYLYRRIEGAVRQMIREAGLGPGDRLPSDNELSRRFGTTRVTVAKALAALEREGLVQRLVGRGTFVASPDPVTAVIDTRRCYSFEEQVGLSGRRVQFRLLTFVREPAPPLAQTHLKLRSGDQVYRMERQRIIDGQVVGLDLRYIPPEFAVRITAPMLAEQSTLEFMSTLLGHHVPTIAVTLYAETASEETAGKLGILPGSPVTVREHVYLDRDRRVVLCGRNIFTSDVRLSYVLGDAPLPPSD